MQDVQKTAALGAASSKPPSSQTPQNSARRTLLSFLSMSTIRFCHSLRSCALSTVMKPVTMGNFPSFKSYVELFHPLQVNFYKWYKIGVKCYPFARGCPVFPTSFTQTISLFSIEYFWFPCQLVDRGYFWALGSVPSAYVLF